VVTVGEKIGKDHLTYAQGGAAEITAMVTIGAADAFGLPVSTTHVSVGSLVGIGIVTRKAHWKSVGKIALSWVITLPCGAALAAIIALVLRILHPMA